MAKLFSDRNRPVHMGRFPTEILKRSAHMPDLDGLAHGRICPFSGPQAVPAWCRRWRNFKP